MQAVEKDLVAMMFDSENQIVESPCIRNCCLDEQDVCLGCFRLISEITGWNSSTVEDKRAILHRCAMRRRNREKSLGS
ncbi:MAG: DUF1289 domain-containing protein [Neptuniibacter sp.]